MDKRQVEKEKYLYTVKWHDYRMLSPDTATLLFLKDWAQALTDFNEASGKTRYFAFLKNITSFDPAWLKRQKPQFWNTMEKLRQQADAGGFDYQDWWPWAFQALNDSGFQVTFLNAFLNIKIKLKVKERKAEYDRNYTKRSSSPFFRAENYTGNELQRDYYDYLIYKARNPNPAITKGALDMLVDAGELPVDYSSDCSIDRGGKQVAAG